ncbi:sensor histidine kinase [Streptomyces sp. NPDC056987]|uniref:sensor histidine kinase n=1 Tax=Streptomyces sp. NPDC056987 TaxID=3345988 RepID=UPI00363ABA44
MSLSLERYTERHPHTVDAVTVFGLFGCAIFGSVITTPDSGRPPQEWPAQILIAVVSCVAVVKGRSHPRTGVIVTAAGAVLMAAGGYLLSPLLLAPVMAALYWLATLTDSRTTRVYGCLTMAAVVATGLIADPSGHSLLLRTVGPVLWLMLPLTFGGKSRLRRAYTESVHARAAHAERTREEEARLRVAEERLRIARELHDVVAHHMAVANAQAGTAAHLARSHPEQAQRILADLTSTTSSALLELRATVGVLRQADDPDADSLEPAPGLYRLPELISACESAGLALTVTTEGEPRPLTPGVDLTAYRIIQEALTNVTKHAAGRAARVQLAYRDSRLLITVTNDGPVAAAATVPGGGFGLMGMRERAHSVGGDLRAGPRAAGGYEVTTALPIHSQALEERREVPAGEEATA